MTEDQENLLGAAATQHSPAIAGCLAGLNQIAKNHGDKNGDAVFVGFLMVLFSSIMDEENEHAIASCSRRLRGMVWPEQQELRRRLEKLLDDIGIVDDTHAYN